MTSQKPRLNWSEVLDAARTIIGQYDTGVTLRQLFYRLVATEILSNTRVAYQTLSARTAAARRQGTFPQLIDRTRQIHRYQTFAGPDQARSWLRRIYRRDRTEGQQLEAWFGELGIPILALGGYTSQSYVSDIQVDVLDQKRPAVLIYAGDFDPSGEDIDRDFLERSDCFERVVRVALTTDQVAEYQLPEQMGKASDSRARGFIQRHGRLVQVELDALAPDQLHRLYDEAIATFWDESAYSAAVERERAEASALGEAS